MRLDPRRRDEYLHEVGLAYVLMGRYDEAVPVLKRHLARYPNSLGAHLVLAVAYSELGLREQSRAEAAEVIRISPQFSLETWNERSPFKDQTFIDRVLPDLRSAGLK